MSKQEQNSIQEQSGKTEAVIIIKAAPQSGVKHGETVCCAGIDLYGNWLRLYPVSFRYMEDGQKFARWDKVTFEWRLPDDDKRIESLRIDQQSLQITGKLKKHERASFLSNKVVTSLDREREQGRSLALLKIDIKEFIHIRKPGDDYAKEIAKFKFLQDQADLFNAAPLVPYKPCPYTFKYRYTSEDGDRLGTCQDWEIEATYFNWSKEYGEPGALDRMHERFGQELPKRGMVFAMGTHSQHPDTWLINGIIRLDSNDQSSFL